MVADRFPAEGSALQRYAARFNAAEINSTFHRPHRPTTYARWAESVPAGFRFAVKLPKTITHRQRLVDCGELLGGFADEIAGLGDRRGPLLVQLPPSLAFEAEVVESFFSEMRAILPGPIACEPRHPGWFEPSADALLAQLTVARVAADPALAPGAECPGGWQGLAYIRLHGTPRTYWSAYDEDALHVWAERVRQALAAADECWIVFDNTAGGHAAGNALGLRDLLG
jgi:uncharacterized protein YecE (DUF72 family)